MKNYIFNIIKIGLVSIILLGIFVLIAFFIEWITHTFPIISGILTIVLILYMGYLIVSKMRL